MFWVETVAGPSDQAALVTMICYHARSGGLNTIGKCSTFHSRTEEATTNV
jgi:hypothetical protein